MKKGNVVDNGAIPWIIEWLWVPLYVAVVEIFRRFFGLGSRVSVLESDKKYLDEQHKETISTLKSHNDAVITAITTVQTQTDTNGKRIGSIEQHLRKGKD